jgi:ribonuclease PH
MHVEVGTAMSAVAGSSAVTLSKSRVMCVVRGPAQSSGECRANEGRLTCTITRAPFAFPFRRDPARHTSTVDDDRLATMLCDALERAVLLDTFPQLQYDVSIEVISADGAEQAACVAAASAALLQAGVECRDTLGAVHGIVTADGGFIDIASPEAASSADSAIGTLFVIAGIHSGELLACEATGNIPGPLVGTAASAAVETVKKMWDPLTTALHADLKR